MENEGNWKDKAKAIAPRKKKKAKKTRGSRSLDASQTVLSSPSGPSHPGLSGPTGPPIPRPSSAPPPHGPPPRDMHFTHPRLRSPVVPSPLLRTMAPQPQRNGSGFLRVRQPPVSSSSTPHQPPSPSALYHPPMPGPSAPYRPPIHSPSAPFRSITHAPGGTYTPQPFTHASTHEALPQGQAPTGGLFPPFRTLDSFLESENTSPAVREQYHNMSPFERQLFDPIYQDAMFDARVERVPETQDEGLRVPTDSTSQRTETESPLARPGAAAEPSEASDRAASTACPDPSERMLITPVGKNRYQYKAL